MVAGESFNLVISTRRGRGSLQVTTAGSGNRPSILTRGGMIVEASGVGVDDLRKKLDLDGESTAGAN